MTQIRNVDVISPLQAFLFAVAVSVALIFVLVPVLPGESPLQVGDAAFKTFSDGGQVIVEEGEPVDQTDLSQIRDAGLLKNRLEFDGALAAMIIAVLGGALLGVYLYLFQPPEMNSLRRLVMVGLLAVLWVAASKVFLSLTLPDDDRLFLGYILPVASAGMLIATLLDGGLAIAVAALLAVLASFAGYYLPDARNSISHEPLQALEMPLAFLLGGLAGIFA